MLKVNPSTLTGALDIIIIEHPDGTLRSSPWHVRFGKLGLIHHTGKVITIEINGHNAPFTMFVDSVGRGSFFATQGVSNKESEHRVYYPSMSGSVNIRPNDVRSFLNNKSPVQTKHVADLDISMILRDSAVDLEAAIEFEDPDPLPVSTVSSSVDLAQSLRSTKITQEVNEFNPVPSALVLQSIRPLLKNGENKITFTVSSLIQGPKAAHGSIYLWNADTKLVVSDVDGTVTSSDLMGHILPTLGKDWTHPGLAKLYQKISQRGVEFVYLSSRPIGEAPITRKMLREIDQDGQRLPGGPLITAPDAAITAMTRELKKRPHEFKIPTLQNIVDLFAPGPVPFIFGFGNRPTDTLSYNKIGLSNEQILLFNTKHRVMDATENILFDAISDVTPVIDDIMSGDVSISSLPRQEKKPRWDFSLKKASKPGVFLVQ